MPGLPTRPCFYDIDLDPETEQVDGLFWEELTWRWVRSHRSHLHCGFRPGQGSKAEPLEGEKSCYCIAYCPSLKSSFKVKLRREKKKPVKSPLWLKYVSINKITWILHLYISVISSYCIQYFGKNLYFVCIRMKQQHLHYFIPLLAVEEDSVVKYCCIGVIFV